MGWKYVPTIPFSELEITHIAICPVRKFIWQPLFFVAREKANPKNYYCWICTQRDFKEVSTEQEALAETKSETIVKLSVPVPMPSDKILWLDTEKNIWFADMNDPIYGKGKVLFKMAGQEL